MTPEIIRGSRGSGKTSILIQYSCDKQIPIMVANPARVINLEKQARDMGYYNLPKPLLALSCIRGDALVGRRDVLIDDVDDVIQTIFGRVDIHAVTYTSARKEYDLDEIQAKTKEFTECLNSYHHFSFGKGE